MSEPLVDWENPQAEASLRDAAQRLQITIEHVRELLANGQLTSRGDGDEPRLLAGEVEAYRRRRQRGIAAARRIAEIVEDSPGGWDS